jgi:hypothetical protein
VWSKGLRRKFDLPVAATITALDGRHTAEQLGGTNREIVVVEPVAARNEERLFGTSRTGQHPMNEKPFLARVQYDFPTRNFGNVGAPDGNQVTRKNGRHHARAENTKTNFSKCADNFSGKTACQPRRCILWLIHECSKRQAMRLFDCARSWPG